MEDKIAKAKNEISLFIRTGALQDVLIEIYKHHIWEKKDIIEYLEKEINGVVKTIH